MQDESERVRWVVDVQKNMNMQIAIFQQQMREMEAERDREREAAKSIQNFQASQLRDIRATYAQVQYATVTPVPDAVSRMKTESGIANFQQDAKASFPERTRWWERFQTLAFQGGWSDKMKVYELRLKLSSSAGTGVHNCHHTCGATGRGSPRSSRKVLHHEATQGRDPLDLLYRLNDAADRADIRYKKSEQRREQHVKRFTHRLADSQLKSILKSQRFKSMDDLENGLRQQEDDWDDDRQSGSSTKTRDFRADNLRQGRLKTKYPGRAYVAQSGDESEADERHVIFEDEVPESASTQESIESREVSTEGQGAGMTMEELTQHVLKVMVNSGWNKPGHMAHQGNVRQNNGYPGPL
ncbi:hypothetical protein PHMEG_00023662 [Phytophthora megakarya]|uniref:Uncharacterized protein n=1 Tax=Phytophthora megakarya TaxID=4795 RepID=A0A225VHJ9_9STRA|nr:hypothetical protein PHMEG_00023662 [Phytophthora megakarya]